MNDSSDSDQDETKTKVIEEKKSRSKKNIGNVSISKFCKVKRNCSFNKRLKLEKSASSASIILNKKPELETVLVESGPSSFPNLSPSKENERIHGEKSLSDTESSWKTAENSGIDLNGTENRTKSVINVENSKYRLSILNAPRIVKRTESLENMQKMPAYGDLVVDSSAAMSNHQGGVKPKDHLYKILVIGDLGTGKTSIIKRYVHQFFSQHYRATIGVDFALKVLRWDVNTLIRLQLWDIAGQERYGKMTRVYFKEAVGAFIVFDVTRVNTFESVANWKADLDSKVQLPDGSPIPCVLLANKCDQEKEGLVNSPSKMNEYCKEKGFTKWYETSAKENINIDEAARALVSEILRNDKLISEANKDGDKFSLANNTSDTRKKTCSC